MALTRKFLGLQQPALHSAAEYLFARYARPPLLDLRNTVIVVPGRRAGRRLLEVLVDRAESDALRLRPPDIATVGRLPEHLYHPQRPFANELVQRLAWVSVLKKTPPDQLAPLVPHAPEHDDVARWLELAELLRRRHVELAAERMDFEKVAQSIGRAGGESERRRWETMAAIQSAYHSLLDRLELWDRQTARLIAIKRRECGTDQDIVLLGTVDMSLTMRAMLDQVDGSVTALVFADDAWQERFDQHGCLLPNAWREVAIGLRDDQLEIVSGPQQQAEAAVRQIASYDGKYGADEIIIGVPDEQLIPHLEREMSRYELPVRWGPGRPFAETAPFRLFAALGRCIQFNRFRDWATLVRHPDVEAWLDQLGAPAQWLTALDRYQTEHLPFSLPRKWLGAQHQGQTTHGVQDLQGALAPLRSLVESLRAGPRPLDQWGEPLLDVLLQVYSHREFDRRLESDRTTIASCERIRDTLQEQAATPGELLPVVTASESVDLLLDEIRTDAVPGQAADAVELLGWLELSLDDAPALILTSVNEGFVPESVNSDLFLPDSIRSQLGLFDNQRRYARDAYALSVLLAVRESLHVITGRTNRDGDPLAPSRLLFATNDEQAARRALSYFRQTELRMASLSNVAATGPSALAMPPRPVPQPNILHRLAVTSFRNYLACPYRFYLRHVLKLRALDDQAEELDAGSFGSLAHEVLRRFGQSRQRDSTDAGEIRGVLNRELNRHAAQVFGGDVTPAVKIQIEQLRVRLDAFSARQADWCAAGWQIEHIEVPQAQHSDATLEVDGDSCILTGRIDRIDIHRDTGERIILDYKTSDAAKQPDQAHRKLGQWFDLQLPLYRHLARSLQISEPLKLGYVLLPKDTTKTAFTQASWTSDELQQADEQAKQVVRDIRAERFWPPAASVDLAAEYAAICREGIR